MEQTTVNSIGIVLIIIFIALVLNDANIYLYAFILLVVYGLLSYLATITEDKDFRK